MKKLLYIVLTSMILVLVGCPQNVVTVPSTVSDPIVDTSSKPAANGNQNITITCSTTDANIFYTDDGTDPQTNGKKYTAPFSVNVKGSTKTIKAIATKEGWVNSQQIVTIVDALSTETTPANTVAKPLVVVTDFDSSGKATLKITCATDSADLKYSLDNGTTWQDYTAGDTGVEINDSALIIAKASKANMWASQSELVRATKWFTMEDITSGTFTRSGTDITVSDFSIADSIVSENQFYDIMGRDSTGTWYDAVSFCNALSVKESLDPVYIISGTNVVADWSKTGYRLPTEAEWECAKANSVTMSASAEWCWDFYAAYNSNAKHNPTGPDAGTNRVTRTGDDRTYKVPTTSNIDFRVVRSKAAIAIAPTVISSVWDGSKGTREVTLTNNTSGVEIYYTLDGSTPTERSTLYSGDFDIELKDNPVTVKTIALKNRLASFTSQETYEQAKPIGDITIKTDGAWDGETGTRTVTVSCVTDGVDLFYSNNGGSPTNDYNSSGFGVELKTAGKTVKVLAKKDGYMNKEVSQAFAKALTFDAPIIATSGDFNGATGSQNVTITPASVIDGTKIKYKKGSDDFTQYTDAFSINRNNDVNITAKLSKDGYMTKETSETIAAATKIVPTINVTTPFTTASTTFTITTNPDGATIEYSFDGTNWQSYSKGVEITNTTTIYARATKVGCLDSNKVSKTATKDVYDGTTIDALKTEIDYMTGGLYLHPSIEHITTLHTNDYTVCLTKVMPVGFELVIKNVSETTETNTVTINAGEKEVSIVLLPGAAGEQKDNTFTFYLKRIDEDAKTELASCTILVQHLSN